MKRVKKMEKCTNLPFGKEGCCYYFSGECGGHAYYPDDYQGKKIEFKCVEEILRENMQQRNRDNLQEMKHELDKNKRNLNKWLKKDLIKGLEDSVKELESRIYKKNGEQEQA